MRAERSVISLDGLESRLRAGLGESLAFLTSRGEF